MLNLESEYRGYPVINTDNPTKRVKRLNKLGDKIFVEKLPVEVPLRYQIEGINPGRTAIVHMRLIHKNPDETPGEFDGNLVVRVLDGLPKEILVTPDKVSDLCKSL